MLRPILFPLLLAAAPLALAEPLRLACGPITDSGARGSGLAQQQCIYGGTSLADAYRLYLEYERAQGERASAAHLLPVQLPKRDTHQRLNEHSHYRISWQGDHQVQVVLTYEGDAPSSDTYRLRRDGGMVEIIRLYEAP